MAAATAAPPVKNARRWSRPFPAAASSVCHPCSRSSRCGRSDRFLAMVTSTCRAAGVADAASHGGACRAAQIVYARRLPSTSVSVVAFLAFGWQDMGLAPMAVLPREQRRGIGSALVRAGLDRCKQSGFSAAVVLGHPAYYPRFGFTPASRFAIKSEYDVPDEAFMALEFEPGILHD